MLPSPHMLGVTKRHTALQISALAMVFALLLPFALRLQHAFGECNHGGDKEGGLYLQKAGTDCSLTIKFNTNQSYISQTQHFTFFQSTQETTYLGLVYTNLPKIFHISLSLRAPPSFV